MNQVFRWGSPTVSHPFLHCHLDSEERTQTLWTASVVRPWSTNERRLKHLGSTSRLGGAVDGCDFTKCTKFSAHMEA